MNVCAPRLGGELELPGLEGGMPANHAGLRGYLSEGSDCVLERLQSSMHMMGDMVLCLSLPSRLTKAGRAPAAVSPCEVTIRPFCRLCNAASSGRMASR